MSKFLVANENKTEELSKEIYKVVTKRLEEL